MDAQLALPLSGDGLRDDALRAVSDNAQPWMDSALALLPQMAREIDWVTGEEIHLWIEDRIGPPHHYNAWGALINTAIRRRILEGTGSYRKCKSPVRHAHRTPVYRFAA